MSDQQTPHTPRKPRTKAARRRIDPEAAAAAEQAARAQISEHRPQISERLWAGVADKRVPNAQAKTMLRDLFGTAPTPGGSNKSKKSGNKNKKAGGDGGSKATGKNSTRAKGPDTAKAAEALGVTQRTVQRWVKDGLPKSAAADELRKQWAASPAARKRQVTPERKARMRSQEGMSVKVRGRFAVSGDPGGVRTVYINDFAGEHRQALMDALIAGDDEAAYAAFIAGVQAGFGGSVDLDIDLESIDLTL